MFSSTKVLIIGKSHQISYLETKDPREPFPLWKMQGCLTLTLKQLKRSSALSLLRTHIFLKQVTSKETEIFWYNVKHGSVPINSNSPYPTQFLSLDVLQAEKNSVCSIFIMWEIEGSLSTDSGLKTLLEGAVLGWWALDTVRNPLEMTFNGK